MEYFWLKQDDRVNHIVMLKGLFGKVELSEIYKGNLSSVNELDLFETNISSKNNVYADVLSSQLFMVKKRLFDILSLSSRKLGYKRICLMDSENKRSEYYYLPDLFIADIDCKREKSNDFKVPDKLVLLNRQLPKYNDVFYVFADNKLNCIVSLRIAEAILRRDFYGLILERVVML